MIPISQVAMTAAEEELVLSVLRSGQLAQGPMVEALERGFAALAGCEHAVAVNSGTTALVAALESLGIGSGDEVVTSPFTFVATVAAALSVGATVRFADIDLDFSISCEGIAPVLTSRTAVILPVHLYGQPGNLPALRQLADTHGLAIVEDCAQAPGASVEGQPVGSFGIGCFSLYATKNITAGEGGVLTTNDCALADRARLLRNQGMRSRYDYHMVGHNYRLTDLQAAVALPQLARLQEMTDRRRANASTLSVGLAGISGLTLPTEAPGRQHVWHQYTVRVTGAAHLDRATLALRLADFGVGTGIYYPKTVPAYSCYASHPRLVLDHVPNAEAAAREVLSLPVHPHLRSADLDHIIESVRASLHA